MQQSLQTRKTVTATKDIDYAIDAKPLCHWSTRCIFRNFFEQCLLFQTSSFYCHKVLHSLLKTWNGLFSFHVLPKERLISFMSGVYSLRIKLKRNQQLRSKSCSMCQNIGGQNSSCLREYLANITYAKNLYLLSRQHITAEMVISLKIQQNIDLSQHVT